MATQHTPFHSRERLDLPRPLPSESDQHSFEDSEPDVIDLLKARMIEFPSIDWVTWDQPFHARKLVGPNNFARVPSDEYAFTEGIWDVAHTLTIHAPEGKVTPWSNAIARWGPVEISPTEVGKKITVRDILGGLYDWLHTPFTAVEWASFSNGYKKQLSEAHNARRKYAKRSTPVEEDLKQGAMRIDALSRFLRWDGLKIGDDFIDSKEMYLTLKDVSLETFPERVRRR